MLFYKKWLRCIIVKLLLSYIQFIYWFFTCLDLHMVSFNFNYCSMYVCGCFYKKWSLCMFVKWLVLYIQFIDWYCTCLDLYAVYFPFNYRSKYFSGCLPRSDHYDWLWNSYYLSYSTMIDSFLLQIWMFFYHLIYCSGYGFGYFTKISVRMYVKQSSFYIQVIAWFFTCLDLYAVPFPLNFCSSYVIGYFTTSDYFVWLWNEIKNIKI